jgi:hypothetical protein
MCLSVDAFKNARDDEVACERARRDVALNTRAEAAPRSVESQVIEQTRETRSSRNQRHATHNNRLVCRHARTFEFGSSTRGTRSAIDAARGARLADSRAIEMRLERARNARCAARM